MEDGVKLYACCPRCGRQICKTRNCEDMEQSCPKCGADLRITVDENCRVEVELLQYERERKRA